jgi:hypothetical protein
MGDLSRMALKRSGDKAGPHPGFDASFESLTKRPRLQGHFRLSEPDDDALNILRQRVGVQDLDWDRLLEVDLDYDWKHGSNPLCRYRGLLPSLLPWLFKGKPAEELFQSRWIENPLTERVR